jgi:hypothetical protein
MQDTQGWLRILMRMDLCAKIFHLKLADPRQQIEIIYPSQTVCLVMFVRTFVKLAYCARLLSRNAHIRLSARPPLDMSVNLQLHVTAEAPLLGPTSLG